MNKDIVDLQMDENGTYTPSSKSKTKNIVEHKQQRYKQNAWTSNKYITPAGADEFLAGVDAGLDFVDAVKVRALRIMGMRD